MLPSERFIILVALDDLRDVVDVVARRIRILLESMKLLVFWYLSDELLKIHLLLCLALLHYSSLIFPLLLPPLPRLEQLLLLLSLLLHVSFHLCDLGFNEVQLLMQLQVILVLLLLEAFFLVKIGAAGVFVEFLAPFALIGYLVILRGWILSFLPLVSGWLFLLIINVSGLPVCLVALPGLSSPVSVHIWRVVLSILLLITVVLKPGLDGLINLGLSCPWGVVLTEPIVVE